MNKPLAPISSGGHLGVLLVCLLPHLACGGGAGADVPLPEHLEDLDPSVVQRIRTAAREVVDDPGDDAAWGRLGMTYEANEIFTLATLCYGRATMIEDAEDESKAKWLQRMAVVEAQQGRTGDAISTMQLSIEMMGDYAPSHWRLGGYLFDTGEFDAAEAAYRRATEADPEHLGGWTGLARIYMQRDQTDEAITLLDDLAEKHPTNAYLRKLLQTAYRQAGWLDEAAAIDIAWGKQSAFGDDPWQKEFRRFRERPLMERALSRLQGGKPDKAVLLLEEFAAEKPDDVNVLAYLAWGYFQLGRADDALRTCDDALSKEPNSIPVLDVLVQIHERSGDRTSALETLDQIVAVDPLNVGAWKSKGRLHFEQEAYPEALAAVRAVLEYDQRDPDIWLMRGRCELRLRRPADAVESFGKAAAAQPGLTEAHLGSARAHWQLGQFEEASQALENAPELGAEGQKLLEQVRARIRAENTESEGDDGV